MESITVPIILMWGFLLIARSADAESQNTGLIEEAVKELDIDCSRSYMVGDRGLDIEFAHKLEPKEFWF